MTRERPVVQSGFAQHSVVGFAGLLLACLAGTGCAEDAGEGQVDTQSAALEDDPLDGVCSRIGWEFMPHYLDAYTTRNGSVVTRAFQNNNTQLWCFTRVDSFFPRYTIQHRTFGGQFVDAYGTASNDYRVVLRDAAFSNGAPHPDQVWELFGSRRLRQVSTGRYLDGHTSSSQNYRAVTRTWEGDGSQHWDIESLPENPCEPTGSAPVPGCEPPPPACPQPPEGATSPTCP